MNELILLLKAEVDVQSAYARYEDYQSGRGEVFVSRLDAAFTLIRLYPEIAGQVAKGYRRMLIRDFPYGIFYKLQGQRIIVTAVLDLRQDPEVLRKRLLD